MNNMKYVLLLAVLLTAVTASAQKYENGLIDKTIAIVGSDKIMLSQLETEVYMMAAYGHTSDRNLRCEVLETMLEGKLFLIQAKLDSMVVNQDMVNAQMDEWINNVVGQLGGEEAAEKYFGKSLFRLRQERETLVKDQSLTSQMQSQVASSVTMMTPIQVKAFYKKMPKDSLPVIPTQYKISHIVKYPDVDKAALAVKERLLGFRERIIKGESFKVLAAMYSQDPGSAMKGGELGLVSKNIYWQPFSDAAMSLKVGQVSPVVETPDGFHIIEMLEKKGDLINVRHILLKPTYTSEDRNEAFGKLDSLRNKIVSDSIKFDIAARFFSEDPKSRTNGGQLADENTGSVLFEKDQLKPSDYKVLMEMEVGDVSEPFESTDNEGRNGNLIYKIIKLDEIVPSHVANFESDFTVLQNVANQKLSMQALDDFIDEKMEETYIVVDPLFSNCKFKRAAWLK